MRISLCYNYAQVVPQPVASKLLRNCRGRSPGETHPIAFRALITSLSAAWEFLLFLVLGIRTNLSSSVYRLQGRKMTGVYIGTDFAFLGVGSNVGLGIYLSYP